MGRDNFGIGKTQNKHEQELNEITKLLGKSLGEELGDLTTGPPLGFMLMVFDFGEGGFLSYVSNAQRADMVKVLREQADRLEAKMDDTKGQA